MYRPLPKLRAARDYVPWRPYAYGVEARLSGPGAEEWAGEDVPGFWELGQLGEGAEGEGCVAAFGVASFPLWVGLCERR